MSATDNKDGKSSSAKEETGAVVVGAPGGNLKLKDPNQAHETLDITKNVP